MAQNQQQTQLEQMGSQQQQANQIVHVRMDSDTQLEELFKHALSKENNMTSSSWQMKKLPASFFTPPSSAQRGNHSREGSADSTHQRFGAPSPTPGLQPIHQRSRSSPAQLPTNILTVPTPPQHFKQTSADFTNSQDVLSQLQQQINNPASTQAQNTRYFINHLTPQTANTPTSGGFSLNIPGLGPLPTGWEQAVTPQGEVYFINHIDKSTSWYDPRIPRQLQRPGMTVQQLQQLQNQMAQQALQRQQQQQQAHAQQLQQSQAAQSVTPGQSPTPTAQQQALIITPQRPPQAPQSQPSPQQQAKLNAAEQQLQQQLQRIRIEQEELTKKQEQLKRQEILLASVMHSPAVPGFQQQDIQTSQAGTQSSVTSVSTSGVDPFLGQAGNSTIIDSQHARQSSGDSGLGGMGNSYSLPRTPEDFLTVEEMERDMAESGHKLQLDGMQNTMEVGGLGDSSDTPTGMESDDLVPSLQEDLGSDLLTEVDLQKMDNSLLTWL